MSCNRCDKCNVPINAIKPDVFSEPMSGYNILCGDCQCVYCFCPSCLRSKVINSNRDINTKWICDSCLRNKKINIVIEKT